MSIYLIIVEVLQLGLAGWLNEKLVPRGRWIREIEYPYLVLGLAGLFFTVNRLPNLEGRIEHVDLLGPIIIVTAVAIKLVKTRAEVYDWGKLKYEDLLSSPAGLSQAKLERDYAEFQRKAGSFSEGKLPAASERVEGSKSS